MRVILPIKVVKIRSRWPNDGELESAGLRQSMCGNCEYRPGARLTYLRSSPRGLARREVTARYLLHTYSCKGPASMLAGLYIYFTVILDRSVYRSETCDQEVAENASQAVRACQSRCRREANGFLQPVPQWRSMSGDVEFPTGPLSGGCMRIAHLTPGSNIQFNETESGTVSISTFASSERYSVSEVVC